MFKDILSKLNQLLESWFENGLQTGFSAEDEINQNFADARNTASTLNPVMQNDF